MPGDLLAALLARCRSAAPARAVGRHSYSNLSPFFP
jgi:hydroxyacyl-ACP dehydratase HTD2-like protein with hotdog domain